MPRTISVAIGLNCCETKDAASLYWQAFSEKLHRFLGPKKRGENYILKILNKNNVFVARDQDNHILGLSGFRSQNGGVIEGSFDDLASIYGFLGALWRSQFMKLLEREENGEILHLDAVCVDQGNRGEGVGREIICFAKKFAKSKSLKGIELDVISTNVSALRFYKKLNFNIISEEKFGFLGFFLGYNKIIRMRLDI